VIGAFLALGTAITLGLNTAIVRRSAAYAPAYYLIVISLVVAAPVFVGLAFLTGQAADAGLFSKADYWLLALAGLLTFIGGRFSNFLAIQAIGANLTAPVRTLSTLFSAVLGFGFLNEEITTARIIGIALLVIAPLIAFSRPSRMRVELKAGTPLKLTEGLGFAVLAATSYALANFVTGYVMAGSGLSILGAAVAHVAAASVMLATLAIPGRLGGIRLLERRSAYAFALISATMILAQVLRFAAFEQTDVAVASALIETLAFFGLGFAFLINRDREVFGWPVVSGILLAVVGAVSLTI